MDTIPADQKPPARPTDDPVQPIPASDEPVDSLGTPPAADIPSAPSPTPSTPPDAAPPDTPSEKETPDNPDEIPVKKNIDFLSKALLVLGPLFMIGALAFSFYNLKLSPRAKQALLQPAGVDSGVVIENQEDYAKYAPTNPTAVRAYADSSKEVELVSGQEYSYDNPYFEWSGAQVNEPNVEITGYFVSFGERHAVVNPSSSMVIVNESFYSPKEHGLTLEKGKSYKLFIQTITNGKAPLAFDREAKMPAVAIFEYVYQ